MPDRTPMMMPDGHRVRLGVYAGIVLAASLAAGCASAPRPQAQMTRADTLVGEAERGQAQRYAAADLQRARDELGSAQRAQAAHHYRRARALAESAAADANLATARASDATAERAAAQVRDSLDTLRQQIRQNAGSAPGADSDGSGTGPADLREVP